MIAASILHRVAMIQLRSLLLLASVAAVDLAGRTAPGGPVPACVDDGLVDRLNGWTSSVLLTVTVIAVLAAICAVIALTILVALRAIEWWPRGTTAVAIACAAVLLVMGRNPWLFPGLGLLSRLVVLPAATVLAIASVVAMGFAVMRKSSRPRGRGAWWLGAPALVLTIAHLADVELRRGLPAGAFLEPFDRQRWREPAARAQQPGLRYRMLGDLVQHRLPGLSMDEVRGRVGESDVPGGDALQYDLGGLPDRFGYGRLLVEFDAERRVSGARVVVEVD